MDAIPVFIACALLVMSAILLTNIAFFPRLRPAASRLFHNAPDFPRNHPDPAGDYSPEPLKPAKIGYEHSVFADEGFRDANPLWRFGHVSQNIKHSEIVSSLVSMPRISILIPARDEAAVIGDTLSRLTAQIYPDFEIIVLDDHSSDDTARIARAAGDNIRVISGAPLPPGWSGKNWACQQLAAQANGDILLFTDADVRWEQGALGALASEFLRTDADLLTIWPTQTTITWTERLTVPLIALVILAYLPVLGVHYLPVPVFGAANGQCMAWRRKAYFAVGGHDAVRATVLEDVTLARIVKSRGMRLRMADGAGMVKCRMYTDWPSVRRGFAKNILAGYGGAFALVLATFFHGLVFLYPIAMLPFAANPLVPLSFIALALTLRALTAAFTRQRPWDALAMPLSVLLMTVIALQALYWHFRFGGPVWKGRTLTGGSH